MLLGCEVCLGIEEVLACLCGLPVIVGWIRIRFFRVRKPEPCECQDCCEV
jgi:hypothetical protein